ncbi:hypothetical protein [Winogradskyella sp. A2]|uniref:hypothetical protein n=1 Tax=Winogradskyella sp. A2 TaxID=3366944 RepID=UPI00398C7E40
MIDYTKILLVNVDKHRLEQLNCLEFEIEVSEKTGAISDKKTAEYHHCKIISYDSGRILFIGSIHKMYNSLKGITAPNSRKGYNGNQFTLNNIKEVRCHLCSLFDCEPNQIIFQNIEFGINTTIDFSPQSFIKGLLFHYGKPFEFRYNRQYAEVSHTRYRIKVYNKSDQYGLSNHTLRIELSHKKALDFKETGIKTFADVNQASLSRATELLIRRFDEIVYYDNTIDKLDLNISIRRRLDFYSNINFWMNLKPNKRDKHKKQLQKVISEKSKNLHSILRCDLNNKGVIINQESKKGTEVIINTSNIELNLTHKLKRKCSITGIDLSLEDNSAKYVRTSTIKYLRLNDNETFQMLCSLYIPHNGKRPRFEHSLVAHLCKNIRNTYYNQNKFKQQGYNKKRLKNQLKLSI